MYNDIATHFNNTRVYQWPWVKKHLGQLEPNSLVYDIGCGNGRNMDYPYLTFVGIDSCLSFCKICRKKSMNVIHADMKSIPVKSYSADAIICIAAFHHIKTVEERIETLKEFKRIIKSDKNIIISVWSINQPDKTRRKFEHFGDTVVPWNSYGVIHYRYYYIFQIDEIKNLFNECGFSVISHEYDCENEIFVLRS